MYIFFAGLTRRRSPADLGATPTFHRLLSRPVTLGDPLGIPWDSFEIPCDPWDSLGRRWAFLRDASWSSSKPSGTSWDPLGRPWRALWDHLEVLLDTLGVSWGLFRGNLELQGVPSGFKRGSSRALGGILGALWRLRNGLPSNSLQYAKAFKFTVRYCKNRGPKRVKSLKI